MAPTGKIPYEEAQHAETDSKATNLAAGEGRILADRCPSSGTERGLTIYIAPLDVDAMIYRQVACTSFTSDIGVCDGAPLARETPTPPADS